MIPDQPPPRANFRITRLGNTRLGDWVKMCLNQRNSSVFQPPQLVPAAISDWCYYVEEIRTDGSIVVRSCGHDFNAFLVKSWVKCPKDVKFPEPGWKPSIPAGHTCFP